MIKVVLKLLKRKGRGIYKRVKYTIFLFLFFYIRCIILRTILRMQPLGYGAIVLYT